MDVKQTMTLILSGIYTTVRSGSELKNLIVLVSWQILCQKLKGENRLPQNTGAHFIERIPVTLGF